MLLTLAPVVPAPRGSASAEAPDFYALADSQIVLGPSFTLRREPGPVPLYVAVYAE